MKVAKLFEGVGIGDQLGINEEWLSKMANDCSDIIKSKVALFRGIQGSAGAFGEFPIRQDRKSLSGNYFGTAVFNVAFERVHGIGEIRNRCAFASISPEAAAEYGKCYAVLPINSSQFAFHPELDDTVGLLPGRTKLVHILGKFVADNDDYTSTLREALSFVEDISSQQVLNAQQFDSILKRHPDVIQQGMEVMITQLADHLKTMVVATPSQIASSQFIDRAVEVMVVADRFYAIDITTLNRLGGATETENVLKLYELLTQMLK